MKYIFKIPVKIYRWCTKTRLRKIMSSILAVLMILTSIKYIFISPKNAKAADIFLKMDEGYGTTSSDTNSNVSAGTINGAVWRTDDLCRDGKCMYFDGNQDFVSFADDADLDFINTDNFTINVWFRHAPMSAGTQVLINKLEDVGTDGGYEIQMESDGDITCQIENSDANTTIDDSATSTAATYDDNRWHMATCVKNASSSLTLYIDGVQVAQDASLAGTPDLSNGDTFYIGIDGDGTSNDYAGFLDEVKVYRSARSATEIKADFLAQTTSRGVSAQFGGDQSFLSDALVGYWKFDEGTGTSVTDYSGNGNTETLSASSWTAGKFGNGWDGDGGKWVTTGADDDDFDFTASQSFTYTMWVKSDSASNPANNEFLIDKENASAGYGVYFTTNGFPAFGVDDDSTFDPDDTAVSATDVYDGNWHQIAAVKTGTSKIELFVDGVSVASDTSISATGTLANSDFLTIGAQDNAAGNDEFTGNMDGVRVYERALSDSEVLALYSWAPSPVGYWSFNEGTGTTANDYSTSGNTGTLSGTTKPSWISGKSGSALSFDGSTSYVAAGTDTSLQITKNLTLSAWIKLTSNTTTQDIIARNGTSGSYNYRLYVNSSGQLAMEVSSNGTTTTTVTGGSTLSRDIWYHVAGTYIPSTSMSVYINGVQDGQNTSSIPASINNSASVALNLGTENNGAASSGAAFVKECGNSAATGNVTVTCSTTGGNLVVVTIQGAAGSTTTYTVSDTGGNTYSTCVEGTTCHQPVGSNNSGAILYSLTSASNTSVTVTLTGSTAKSTLVSVQEFSGIQSSPLDATSVNGSETNGTSISSGTTGTTTQANEVAVGWVGQISATATFSSLTGGGWTWNGVRHGTAETIYSGYKILSATGTESVSATSDTSQKWTGGIATFKANGSAAANLFSGQMDEARIYNYDRTSKQIIEDMNGGHPVPGSPVGSATSYFRFDEGYGTTAHDDSINQNDLTVSSATAWTNDGKYYKAFNGATNVRASRTDDDDFDFAASDNFSLSLWFKSDSATNPSANEYLLEKGGNIATDAVGYAIYTSSASDGLICFGIDDDSTSFPEDSVCSTSDLYDNTWHHLTAVKTGTTKLELYIDGVLNGTPDTSISATGTLANAATFYIGDTNGTDGTDEFLGDIDDVKIFRSALDTNQVKVVFNENAGQVMGAVSTDSSGNASFSSSRSYCPPGNTDSNCAGSSNPSPVGAWNLDENTGTTANDNSGNANTGTLSGTSPPSWSVGTKGGALSFDGSTSYVNAGNGSSLQITSNLSLSAWIKLTNNTTTQDIVARNGTSGSYNYRLYVTSGGKAAMEVSSNGTATTTVTGATTLSTGTWYHIEGVYVPSTSMTVYVNGVQDAQNTSSIPASINNTSSVALNIGAENNGSTSGGGSFVQECTNNSGGSAVSSLTVNCSTTAGNLLVLMFATNTGSSRSYTAADSNSNALTKCANCEHRPGGITNTGELFYLLDSQASTSVTITITGGSTNIAASLLEFSGIQSSPLDQSTSSFDDTGSTSITSTATGTTSQASEVAVGHLAIQNNGTLSGTGSGWTYNSAVATGTILKIMSGYKILSSTGTQTNTGTAGTSGLWTASAATFKATTPTAANMFSGSIDAVRIYNYARSQAQVSWDYNVGKPLAWYKMDESSWNGTANEVKDSSGNTLHGTAAGNATTTSSGKFNNAGTFDGTGDYVNIADNSKLDITGDFTLTAWVSRAGGVNGLVISKTSGNDGGYALLHGQLGEVYCRTSNGTTFVDSYTNTGILNADSTWHFLTAVRSGTSCRVYIDGVDRTTTTGTHTTLTANSNPVRIGADPVSASDAVNGKIDDARIYNYALSSQQIKTIMNEGAAIRYGP